MKIRFALTLIMMMVVGPGLVKSDEALSSRGIFVTLIDETPVLSTRHSIEELIAYCKKNHIQTLFIQVYRANKAWFPSRVGDATPYQQALKNVGEDPFALLIHQAHENGMEVHAWLNLLSLSKNDHAKILEKYGPSILTKNLSEKKTLSDYRIDNQYFLEPGDFRVRRELANMVKEVLRTYPALDGVQFDYIRYPDVQPHYGYTPINIARFKRATHQHDVIDQSLQWQQWKRDQVTDLLKELVGQVHRMRPHMKVSTTGCLSYIRALDEAFQDWPTWVNTGLVDFVTIMNYPKNPLDYAKHIAVAKEHVQDFSKIYIAVGPYKLFNNPAAFGEQLRVCEGAHAKGCAIFHYGSMVQYPDFNQYLN